MHVDDHAAGIEASLRRGKKGEVYNLAPSAEAEAVTEDVIERIRQLVGKGDINKVDDRDYYDLRYWMDASKAKEDLGWEAKYNFDRTLRSTVNWYLDNLSWLEKANKKLSVGRVSKV